LNKVKLFEEPKPELLFPLFKDSKQRLKQEKMNETEPI